MRKKHWLLVAALIGAAGASMAMIGGGFFGGMIFTIGIEELLLFGIIWVYTD